jgi:pyridoxamine 5'-phosphate oxidase
MLPEDDVFAKLTKKEHCMLPLKQFNTWYREYLDTGPGEPTAMVLATVAPDKQPAARVVLMKAYDEDGFVFYTNYQGRKGRELDSNPMAALLFYWQVLDRQVRIEGKVSRVSAKESDTYFNSRPFGSRLSASISPQSEVIPNREYLINKRKELIEKHPDQKIKRPDFWGGFRLAPAYFEFWQAGEYRLHHRTVYELKDGKWDKYLLAP